MDSEKERIEHIMSKENMNATQFAAEIGIQTSTLSHILNGRNNPSLDVLKRVLNRFRTINPDWLILGTGQMYRQISQSQQPVLFDIPPKIDDNLSVKQEQPVVNHSTHEDTVKHSPVQNAKNHTQVNSGNRFVTRILVFYSDNTFEEFSH
ncbi:MAG: helix-turn-helix transcriptional regulator [Bacteroidetes bacterium]|uniref:Helix-turn-helix transcriptional regulator n=1 Tax=Candidatus Gallipaludibacter merdavium TaxID=2840839 RepID=A0A9D9HT80_9BACT|nr:helix-turn-helix transcriptional regulator [Candidatus Gallipaludibacter merdavium]